ncbi:MAG: hypothetical protein JSS20_04210 [Proteobacteria bacterium]|nr:hypothetical protein [Pseudomonadota bacterium]
MQMGQPEEGSRARIGVVVPGVNTVAEPWFTRVVPAGVSIHFARMLMGNELTPETVIEMDRTDGAKAIHQVASCRPGSIAYGCTASSMVQGLAYDEHLRSEIERDTGARATTAAHAILTALARFGARRISVVSPYTDAVDEMEHHFFEAAGLSILGSANLGIADNFGLASPSPSDLFALALKGWNPEADALVMTCLNTRSHYAVEAIEREIGKPVVTSTTATLWHALRLAGIPDAIQSHGRLLETA